MKPSELARCIDISAVSATSSLDEVERMCQAAEQYDFIAAFAMPWCTELVIERLKASSSAAVGGVVGFPSGAVTTRTKCDQAAEFVRLGCGEIDMVMNLGAFKSGNYDYISREFAALRSITIGKVMKVIIEAPLLTDDEISIATDLVCAAGADFVKSGTGWHGATGKAQVQLMCDCAKGRSRVKVAGGVRKLDTINEYYNMGVSRFGIGLESALAIMKEATEQNGGIYE